jgi:CRISPR-associated protein (TIGR03984 family)
MNEMFHIETGIRISISEGVMDTSGDERQVICDLWGKNGDATFLAFADDGLIWGKLNGKGLFIGRDAQPGAGTIPPYSPELRWKTLWKAHLFNIEREIRVWKEGEVLRYALMTEDADPEANWYDEKQILLGTDKVDSAVVTEQKITFTRVEDLAGEWHAPPVGPDDFRRRAMRLRIRHYLSEDKDTGVLRVWASRVAEMISRGEEK